MEQLSKNGPSKIEFHDKIVELEEEELVNCLTPSIFLFLPFNPWPRVATIHI